MAYRDYDHRENCIPKPWSIKAWYFYQGKKNPLRRLTYTVIGLLSLIPACALLFLLVNVLIQQTSLNNVYFFGSRPTLVVTESMEPTIMTNSIVIVEDTPMEDIVEGDIIRYNSKQLGYSVIHRVTEVGDGWFVTKGDNNPTIDRWIVTSDMYNGKVTEIHNGAAPFVTLLMGRFDMEHVSFSILRVLIGFIALAIIITAILLIAYYLFEMVTINLYWYKHRDNMQNSLGWMDDTVTKEGFNGLIDEYNMAMKYTNNPFLKLAILHYFREYYDVLCTVESKSRKADRKLMKLDRIIKRTIRSSDNTSTEIDGQLDIWGMG